MAEYNPNTIEEKWRRYWSEKGIYRTPEKREKKFYCLDMFPYPSGDGLHVGHPLGYIATDIYSRFKRMQGYAVLHPMGWDAFGLPAEQHAIATGEQPAIITERNCNVFKRQLQSLGLSYDWEREFATTQPEYYRWTQWIFLKLYNSYFDDKQRKARPIAELPIPGEIQKEGNTAIEKYRAEHRLAYYADALVNWCPGLRSVLANEEVINGRSERGGFEVLRVPMKQWMLRITKYSERLLEDLELLDWPESIKLQQRNWIGRSEGAEIRFRVEGSGEELPCFTTRPETVFGVTFFVVAPEHPLVPVLSKGEHKAKVEDYCSGVRSMSDLSRTIENREKTGVFTGSNVINPVTGQPVPVFVGDYVLMSYGSGAVMGVPAHDERDFDFAKKYSLPIVAVLAPTDGTSAEIAQVVRAERSWVDPGTMLDLPQPVFQELKLTGIGNQEAIRRIIGWLQRTNHGQSRITYKLRDWVFSRQRYWGEPIPIIHWDDGSMTALDDSELPLLLPPISDYQPSETGESPLAKAENWVKIVEQQTGRKGRRETSTMPNWAGSCWYYLRFIDPRNAAVPWDAQKETAWMPVDLYVGGAEHAVLHLLYARFWHKVLYDLGYVSTKEPFQKLFNQGMLSNTAYKNARGVLIHISDVEVDGEGIARQRSTGEVLEPVLAKMSKSLRNVVNPDEIIREYGADALRLYEMFLGPLDAPKIWNPTGISGCHRFLKRVWRLVTNDQDEGCAAFVGESEENSEVVSLRHRLIKHVTEDLQNLHFNTAVAAMMEFVNHIADRPRSRATVETLVRLLAPFAPHITEELWARLGHPPSVTLLEWPAYDAALAQARSVMIAVQVNGKLRDTVEVEASAPESLVAERALASGKVQTAIGSKAVARRIFVPDRLLNFVVQ